MTKRRSTIAIIGGICALALAAAATPASAGGLAFVARGGGGVTCSGGSPCGDMNSALAVAGDGGEVICYDKADYGPAIIRHSVTISCGDGLWEVPGSGVIAAFINTPAGSDVVIEGLVADG